ncbi:DNA repair protein RecO [Jeotgalibaca sp. PTS2502]|uniref:DNA repair protein RecO n=1 Tax=Jeotgalibaca sp. PTS2502 TaxID=1903686 RepID=UPI0009735B7C|nr:DNA repair protein RecO [Jeotgalibaca sp. PTS2502]APZ48723.1 DNA repair protein RecO [Jeotgalibaca sp. PTS2502]
MSKTGFQTFQGIVISVRKHKETDALVKIFTLEYGKRMFFVRHYFKSNFQMKASLLPFTHASYIGTINDDGLSFLRDYQSAENYTAIQQDVYLNAYATYMANLADAAMEDRIPNKELFGLLQQSLDAMNNKNDGQTIMNVYEMNLLTYFGVHPQLSSCRICGNPNDPFDYSAKHSGVLCTNHFHEDRHRLNAHPAAIHFCRIFLRIKPNQVERISLKDDTKKAIQDFIDFLYDEYVGIKLKSKSYIDQMKEWENVLQLSVEKRKADESENT